MPDWPYCLNLRWLAMSGVNAVLPIAVSGRGKLPGNGLPASLFSVGLGSNKSMWLGPPSRKHHMTDLAFAGSGGAFGANGLTPIDAAASAMVGLLINDHSANAPKPPPARSRKSRRDCADSKCTGPEPAWQLQQSISIASLVHVQKLVRAEHRVTEIDHRCCSGTINFLGHRNRELIFGQRRRFDAQLGSLLIDKLLRRFYFGIFGGSTIGVGVGFAHDFGDIVATLRQQLPAPLAGGCRR